MGKSNQLLFRKRRLIEVEQESSFVSKYADKNRFVETMALDRLCEDSTILFSHFPEEIWLLITSKIEDPNSLANLMQASPVFRNLLLPRRVEFLFSPVWKVLGVKFETRQGNVYSYNIDKMYPGRDLSRFKDGETPWCSRILTLRLVCKSWCWGVDEFYDNLPVTENYTNIHYRMEEDRVTGCREYYSSGESMGEWTRDSNKLDAIFKIDKFMEHFDPTHFNCGNRRNPKIGRNICISFNFGHCATRILSLLSMYGHHFWFCELYVVSESIRTRVECYNELKQILQLLPNLKTLKVIYDLGLQRQRSMDMFKNIEFPSESLIYQLEQEIAANPLPHLHQLEFLSVTDLPKSIFNALVSRNSHVSMLEVLKDRAEGSYNIYTFPMPNLKQLSMKYTSKSEFKKLYNPEVNWCLEKVYFSFKSCRFLSMSEISSLLQCKWADTLTNVSIYTFNAMKSTSHRSVVDYCSSTPINLPNVQRFRFISEEFFNFDFILPMKSLEHLEVGLLPECQYQELVVESLRLLEKNQIVQFVGYFGRFQQSNIWNLFPNLKSFVLGKCDFARTSFRTTYTREQCEWNAEGEIIPSIKENLWYTA